MGRVVYVVNFTVYCGDSGDLFDQIDLGVSTQGIRPASISSR